VEAAPAEGAVAKSVVIESDDGDGEGHLGKRGQDIGAVVVRA